MKGVELECRDHWYGPGLCRRPSSLRKRWRYTYQAMARLRRAHFGSLAR